MADDDLLNAWGHVSLLQSDDVSSPAEQDNSSCIAASDTYYLEGCEDQQFIEGVLWTTSDVIPEVGLPCVEEHQPQLPTLRVTKTGKRRISSGEKLLKINRKVKGYIGKVTTSKHMTSAYPTDELALRKTHKRQRLYPTDINTVFQQPPDGFYEARYGSDPEKYLVGSSSVPTKDAMRKRSGEWEIKDRGHNIPVLQESLNSQHFCGIARPHTESSTGEKFHLELNKRYHRNALDCQQQTTIKMNTS